MVHQINQVENTVSNWDCKDGPQTEVYHPWYKFSQLLITITIENATHCGASLSEQLKSDVSFLQLTVLLYLRRTRAFSHYQDSVIVERIEVYANCELL